ncbi:MAG: hypothetical protein U9N39_09320 [Campylobacterota bacterium]|nr:hypothetical protein [Campylobacterota bacterium]
MKSYFYHLFIGVALLLLLGCSSAKPEVVQVKEELPVVVKAEPKEVVVTKTDFIEENFIENDKNNRVFINCFKTGSSTLAKKCQKSINHFLLSTPLS